MQGIHWGHDHLPRSVPSGPRLHKSNAPTSPYCSVHANFPPTHKIDNTQAVTLVEISCLRWEHSRTDVAQRLDAAPVGGRVLSTPRCVPRRRLPRPGPDETRAGDRRTGRALLSRAGRKGWVVISIVYVKTIGSAYTADLGDGLNANSQNLKGGVGGQYPWQAGNLSGNVHRSRHALNADTIREMHLAFRRGGRKAIEKVMRNQPAVFLKLLVLLVPREMKVEQSRGVKEMTDEQLERGIELVKEMLAQREAEANAKVIEGEAMPSLPAPGSGGTNSPKA